MSFSLAVFFLYCFALVIGAPLSVRVVVDPPITSPSATTVWTVGQQVTVTWDTSSIPEPKNFTGRLVLGFQTSDSENLDLDNPLATNISLIAGQVNVTVPNVPHKDSYIVVLFGDSGNASPQFTIAGGSDSISSSFGSVPSSTTDPASTPASAASTPTLFPLTSSGINPGGPFSSSGAPSITFTAPSTSASTSPPSASSSGASSAPSASALGSSNTNDARGVSAPVLSLLCGAMLALVTAF